MKQAMINIVIAADNNYAKHVAVVAASVLHNTHNPSEVCFYILSDNIDGEKRTRIENTIKMHRGTCHFFDVSGDDRFRNMYTSAHISKAAFLRLGITDILPAEVSRVIYLDVDIIVFDDIEKLWTADLEGHPLAAVCDYGIMASKKSRADKMRNLGFTGNEPYFNSGVMILDLDKWREERLTEKALQLAQTRRFSHHDQDVLNLLFRGNWKILPLRWNVIPPIYNLFLKVLLRKDFRREALRARKNMALKHFAGRYKPWEFADSGEFNHAYYEYLALSDFKEDNKPEPGNMKGKSLRRQLFRNKVAGYWHRMLVKKP